MRLYLVKRNDEWSYDDYDSCVVSAVNEERACELSLELFSKGDVPSSLEHLDVTLLSEHSLSQESVILSSFNAG